MEKKLITEMKFMMERLENPRLTYTQYEKKHNQLIKEFEKGFESDTNKEMSGNVLPVESNYISSDEVKDLGIRLKRAFIENGFNVLDPKTSPYWDSGSRGLAVLPKFKPDEKNIFIAVGDTFNGNPSKSNESTEMVMVEFRNPLKNEVMSILQQNSGANTKIEDFYGDRGEISRLYIYSSNNTEYEKKHNQLVKEDGTNIPHRYGMYLLFNKKNGKLVTYMQTKGHKKYPNIEDEIKSKGEYDLIWVDGDNYNRFDGKIKNYIGKTAKELGLNIMPEKPSTKGLPEKPSKKPPFLKPYV